MSRSRPIDALTPTQTDTGSDSRHVSGTAHRARAGAFGEGRCAALAPDSYKAADGFHRSNVIVGLVFFPGDALQQFGVLRVQIACLQNRDLNTGLKKRCCQQLDSLPE